MDTPIFTPAACEGTTTLFEVDYFEDEKAYLTQSGQLYNEANAMAFGKVYCFGPVFRAEKSKTRRHLTEFWMVEPEMAYADLEDVKRVARSWWCTWSAACWRSGETELKVLERDTSKLEAVKAPFPRMSYDDAVKKLQAKGSEIQWGGDFGNADETLLTEGMDRPVMVDRYPTEIKAFYFEPDPDRPEVALGVDVHRARRLWRDHRRRPAHSRSRSAAEAPRRAQTAAGSVRLVPRSAQIWHRAARRLRYGRRARASPGSAAWSMFAKRSRIRACCTARGRNRKRMPESSIAIIGAPMDLGAAAAGSTWVPPRCASPVSTSASPARLRGPGPRQRQGRSAGERAGRLGEARYLPQIVQHLHPSGARRCTTPLTEGRKPWSSAAIIRSRSAPSPASRAYYRERGQNIGLIWIDAHADMNTPDSSPSGNVHGMPLACMHRKRPVGTDEHFRITHRRSEPEQCRDHRPARYRSIGGAVRQGCRRPAVHHARDR